MSRRKVKRGGGKPAERKVSDKRDTSGGFLARYRGTLIVIAGLYLLIAVFFHQVVIEGMGLAQSADMIASAGMFEMGEQAIAEGRFPLWNTTLFCGLPMFASLQYALFVYPLWYPIKFLSYIFGSGDWRIWLFHFLLAALFAYLLARHYGCRRITAWLAGVAYGFSPQLIVLADVGHGSKLMGMTFLPLIWLMIDRLRLRPSVGRAAALGAVFAVEVLALHPEVAAYGALLMAVYLIYYGIRAALNRELGGWGRLALFWGGAMCLVLALSAVLWVSVLDYARFSIRGAGEAGVAGGGVAWDYATGWSFHPLESITFLFPRFLGFGGQTYWGTVGTPQGQPFTHNPMYFGCGVLLLVVLAVVTLPRSKWGFPVVLGLTALALSFGKYLPILYGPLYHILPLFNKFRAPVMGQVLLLLPAALLAGVGLDELIQRVQRGKNSDRLRRVLWWIAGVAALLAVVALVGEGLFRGIYRGFADIIRPGTDSRLLGAAEAMARPDVARVLGLMALMCGLTALALGRKVTWQVLAGLFILVLLVDLWPVNRRLVNFTPRSHQEALFRPEGVVRKLMQDPDKFRIHPLVQGVRPLDSRYMNSNWWSYFGLESTGGYFGAKPAAYQRLMTASDLEGWGALYSHPELLDALNVRYVITSVPIDRLFSELERQGWGRPARPASDFTPVLTTRGGAYVYRNPGELPRTRLVGEFRVVPDFEATVAEMVGGDWDPVRMVLLDREPPVRPGPAGGVAETQIIEYRPERVKVKVTTSQSRLLVLADGYYPSGWRATLDGQPTEILRADGVLRAVAVPAGEHMVEFRFHPKWFYAGLWVSVGAALMALGLWVWTFVTGKGKK